MAGRKEGGFIYAIGMKGTPYAKIGISRTAVQSRLSVLQTGQPFELELIAAIPVASNLNAVERYIHTALAPKKTRGEWFDFSIDAAKLEALVAQAFASVGEVVELKTISPFMQEISRRVRQCRLRKDLTQAQVASVIGMQTTQYGKFERGQLAYVRLDQLYAMVQYLSTTSDYLLTLSDEPDPAKPSRPHECPGEAHSWNATRPAW